MSFYEHFVEVCKEKGIAPSKAAEISGLNKSVVTYWKKGAEPKLETILKIAEALNVDADRLAEAPNGDELAKIVAASGATVFDKSGRIILKGTGSPFIGEYPFKDALSTVPDDKLTNNMLMIDLGKNPDDGISFLFGILNTDGKIAAANCFRRHLNENDKKAILNELEKIAQKPQYQLLPPDTTPHD